MSNRSRQEATATPDKADADGFGIRSRVIISVTLIGALFIGCGGWAAQAKLSGAVIASGEVAVKRQVKEIQHRDGGIVAEILVANGDEVKKGDVLIRLDETETRVELAIIRSQLSDIIAMHARLKAERDGLAEIVFPEGFADDKATAGELKLFHDNRAMRESHKEQLSLQVAQLEDQIVGMQAQLASNEEERALLARDLELMQRLHEKKLVPGSRVRELERDLSRVEGSKGEIESRIAQTKGQISETEVKLLSLDQEMRSEAQAQIRELDTRIAELREREIAALERLSRTEIKAPVSGLVYGLQVHTIGGVVGSGQTVLSLVPENEDMTVEVRVAPVDIDQVAIGQEATLRFSAFNQRTTPELEGRVLTIAAASTHDAASGSEYYLGTVEVVSDLSLLGEKELIPGMPVDVFLSTGDRTAISYLVKPFVDQMVKAFREE